VPPSPRKISGVHGLNCTTFGDDTSQSSTFYITRLF